jgi:Uma2 family endonuclease
MASVAERRIKTRPSVEGAVYVPPGAASSLDAFREWYASADFPEEGRICYLDGELFIDMGHERISSHVSLKTALTQALADLAGELDLGQFFGDGARVVSENGNYSAEPDGCYVTWAAVEEGRVSLQESNDGNDVVELVGKPDLVLEIVSPSSVQKDKTVLRRLYHKSGVPEYWLIDAPKQEIEFAILRDTPRGYVAAPTASGWVMSRAFNREFRLERSKNRIGIWQYALRNRRPKKS